jgi:hypothetical protein
MKSFDDARPGKILPHEGALSLAFFAQRRTSV